MKNFEKLVAELYSFAEESSKAKGQSEWAEWLKHHEDDVIKMLFSDYTRTSRRTKLLVYAVAAGLTREETDSLLQKYKRERLYVRNIADILIMRTLDKGYSIGRLIELVDRVGPLTDNIPNYTAMKGKELTIKSMKNYLDACNVMLKNTEDKSTLTSELQDQYELTTCLDDDEFVDMIKENTDFFSKIRERTRQEFVRYLYLVKVDGFLRSDSWTGQSYRYIFKYRG